ncbi:MAG: ComEC/Rec2 family competence protein [Flavobacteriales bacterium]|nr:ComEC/Rec2 family competence protein [Flavobacteriales bacterium]
MWQALNPPQLQAPLFGPCLLFAVGILVFELPHEPLALAVGVLLIAKPKRLVMVLFIGLGMARIALHIHEYPRNQTKECSLWNCHSADVLKDQSFQCHCSSLQYPTGIEVEWNHVEAPPLNQNFLAIITPFGSRGSFNVDQWKRSKGIHGRLSPLTKTTERESMKQRFRGKASDGCKRVKQWRESIHAAIDSSFSEDTGSFLRAISTGDKSKLSFHMKAAFAHAGIGHLLAVSGYHVGLICFVPLVLLRSRRWIVRCIALIMALACSWTFVAICGWPPSAIRAATMVGLYAICNCLRLPISSIQIWSMTCVGMLLWNPDLAFDVGTQLSFAAVLAILLFVKITIETSRFKAIVGAIGVPIAAQLGTVFIAVPVFNLFPLFFLPFNIFAQIDMVVLGILFAVWGFGMALQVSESAQKLFSVGVERFLDKQLETLQFIQQNYSLAINVEQSESWAWFALSGIYFITAFLLIQKRRIKKEMLLLSIAWAIGIVICGIVHPMQRPSLRIKSYRKPVIHLQEGCREQLWVFDCRDSSLARRKSIMNGVNRPEIICLKPGQYYSNANGDFMLWTSDSIAQGSIAKRPCNYRYTGEISGLLTIGRTEIPWESWGPDAEIN